MSALLKAKSVIAIKRKERVQYPVQDFMKRHRGPPGDLAHSQIQPQTNPTATTSQGSKKIIPIILEHDNTPMKE